MWLLSTYLVLNQTYKKEVTPLSFILKKYHVPKNCDQRLLAVCRTSPEGIGALCGAMLLANIFLGTSNSSTVQPVVGQQRSILYRCLVTHLNANAFWLQTHMHMHGARASQAHCMTHMHHVHMQHLPHMHHMHMHIA